MWDKRFSYSSLCYQMNKKTATEVTQLINYVELNLDYMNRYKRCLLPTFRESLWQNLTETSGPHTVVVTETLV